MKNFQDLDVTDYLRIVRRRIGYLILPAVLISAGAYAYVSRLPSQYRSETIIQVSTGMLPENYFGSVLQETVADRIEFVRQQIQSRTFLERIAQEFQFGGEGANIQGVAGSLAGRTEFAMVPPNLFRLAFTDTDPGIAQAVTRRLAERVMQLNDSVRRERVLVADQFLDEQVRQTESELLEAETRLRQFNQQHFQGLGEVDLRTLESLQSQLAAAELDLANAVQTRAATERRIEEQRQLRATARTLAPQPRAAAAPQTAPAPRVLSPLEQRLVAKRSELAEASSRYTAAHPDVARLNREVQELELQVSQPEPPQEPAPALVPEEAALETLTLPEFDISIEFIEAELQLELERVNRLVAEKEAAQRDLSRTISQYRTRLNPRPEVAQEMAGIERDLQAARERYNVLVTRKLDSELAGRVDTSDDNRTFRIVDPANLPLAPSGPARARLILFGCVAGLMAGFGLVFVREFMDSTLHDEEEAVAELKLPVLTSVPLVRESRATKKAANRSQRNGHLTILPARATAGETSVARALSGNGGQWERGAAAGLDIDTGLQPAATFNLEYAESKIRSMIQDDRTVAGQQYRLMRATLTLMRKQREKMQTILIASTIPNEGKTFTACALAGILAQETGSRVLLIDADLRSSSTTRMFGINEENSTGGLCEVLRGGAHLEHSLLKCADLNLYLLPSGVTGNPAEILASSALERTIRRCEEIFDWIIIDSPPILALADANFVFPVCDTTVLVVNADKTPLKLVKDSVQRIGGDRICGVLMNRVRSIRSTYYYRKYYQTMIVKNS